MSVQLLSYWSGCSWFIFLAVSRTDSGHCHERDGRCRQHTCFYARMRTFFSCTVHASLMFGSRAGPLNVFAQSHLTSASCLCWVSLFVVFFRLLLHQPVFCHDLQPGPHHWLEPEVTLAPLLHGVECLAIWPIGLQTQKQSRPRRLRKILSRNSRITKNLLCGSWQGSTI